MEKIKNAIIIHGPGRSGTTLLSNMLSLHPDLGWISNYVNRYPSWPILTLMNRIQNFKWVEQQTRDLNKWPRPAEAYGFWDFYFPGFSKRSSGEKPVIPKKEAKKCINAVKNILKYQGKKQFVTKITGLARKEELEAIFDRPLIVYIDRDPRAVVLSYMKQRWRYKNKPELFNQKERKTLLREYTDLYLAHYQDKARLKTFPFRQVYYEELVKDPEATVKQILNDAGLPFPNVLKAKISSWGIQRNTNIQRKAYKDGDEELLSEALAKPLIELGYK